MSVADSHIDRPDTAVLQDKHIVVLVQGLFIYLFLHNFRKTTEIIEAKLQAVKILTKS